MGRGIGIHIHNIRGAGSRIAGTNGISNGIVPMLKIFNNTARYVDQGGGKRPGSFAIYLEPHHPDIIQFLDLRKNTGDEELKARDLFYGLWISDYFMKCVQNDEDWYLFCPNECPGLSDCYGEDFNNLFNKYVSMEKWTKKLKARELWFKILDAQMETGTPYMLYKDAANQKSNQKNLGTIKSSNLCTEIIEYSSKDETAVCNLASIALSKFVKDNTFDYNFLYNVTQVIVENLNKIIDINFYPTIETKRSNKLHRPIGIGVQGLADVFFKLNIPFTSNEAKIINKNIFETIYFAALEKSNEISILRYNGINSLRKLLKMNQITSFYNTPENDLFKIHTSYEDHLKNAQLNGLFYKYQPILAELSNNDINDNLAGSYSSFSGSPASRGLLQFDLWNVKPSNRYDWNKLNNLSLNMD